MSLRTRYAAAALALAALSLFSVPACADTSVLRNGSFNTGLAEWCLNSELPAYSALTSDLAAKLYPPVEGFSGTVLYQNLNVTGIGGKQCLVYLWLRKMSAFNGRTIAVYVDYIDSAGRLQRMKILNPRNRDLAYQGWTLASNTFTFPVDAVRLVKFSFDKEGWGEFETDGVMLLVEGVVDTGPVPVVTGISAQSGPYGSTFTINGSAFGAGGEVTIGGSSDGVVIENWLPTQIIVRVEEPAKSGRVCVVCDGVESSKNYSFQITSPTFTVDVLEPEQRVVRGQEADYLIAVKFENGFSTPAGIAFTVPEAAPDTVSFSPSPVMNHGGAVMRIDTSSLAPGTYYWHVEAQEGGSAVRSAPFRLHVVTVADAEFYARDADGSTNPLSVLTASKQKRLYIFCAAEGSDGLPLPENTPYTLGGDAYGLELVQRPWGSWEVYAAGSSGGNLQAVYPDGYTESLPVSVTVPSAPRISPVNCNPSQVSNAGAASVNFTATATEPVDGRGDCDLGDLDGYSEVWTNGDKTYKGTGMVPVGMVPGTYLFHAWLRSDPEVERVEPLTIINDAARAVIRGRVFSLSSFWQPDIQGVVELYDSNCAKMSQHQVSGWGDYVIPYVEPGAYYLRFVPGAGHGFDAQWYPNADSFAQAQAVLVEAGGAAEDISFFLSDTATRAPMVSYTLPAEGAEHVKPDAVVTAVFSRQMDPATVTTATFTLEDSAGTPTAGTVYCDGTTATFTPVAALDNQAVYTAKLTTGVRDASGVSLAQDYTWSFTTASNRTADIKLLPDGWPVLVSGKVLYLLQGGAGYIEEPDRASGIRIEGSIAAVEGDVVEVRGTVQTTGGGERFIQVDWISSSGTGDVRPLGASTRYLRFPMVEGLYVTAWGEVMAGSVTADSYRLNDGSDGTGLLVRTGGPPGVTEGEYVSVRGAAGFDGERVIYAK